MLLAMRALAPDFRVASAMADHATSAIVGAGTSGGTFDGQGLGTASVHELAAGRKGSSL